MTSVLADSLPRFSAEDTPPFHVKLDHGLHTADKVFNGFGYVPLLSIISGSLRIGFGKIMVITAIALGSFLILKAELFSADAEQRSKEFEYGVAVIMHYSLNGVAHMGRGLVETMPFISLACIFYDLSENRVEYPFERV